jgi:group I intron endonuclease
MKKRIRAPRRNPGIYKITSPIGEVYVGQTLDLLRRRKDHKDASDGKRRPNRALKNSFDAHGFDNHMFETIYELPKDVTQEVLYNYENFVYSQYADAGYTLLNLQECGTSKVISAETRQIMSKRAKGMWTDDFRENHIKKRTGRPIHSEEEKARRSIWMKENRAKFSQYRFTPEDTARGQELRKKKAQVLGYYTSPESIEKLRQAKGRLILNTQTGIFYFGCKDAAYSFGGTEDNLRKKLNGQYKNNTPFIYA